MRTPIASATSVAPKEFSSVSPKKPQSAKPHPVPPGVAASRQWNNEFPALARRYRVLRYALRGYGKSEPVAGEFSCLADLVALLDYVCFDAPVVLIGCSMEGVLAMDFALEHPARAKALVMVGSFPSGLREAKHLGRHLPDSVTPAAGYMVAHIPAAQRAVIAAAAHLPNMDHPARFLDTISAFLDQVAAQTW